MKYVEELFVKASLNVILTNPGELVPVDFGTGCIVIYKERNFFISVSHVTKKGLDVYIEANQPHDGKTSPMIPVGGIISYKYLLTNEQMTAEELADAIENGGYEIDFSVAEITEPLELLQNEINFGSFSVSGKKIFPYLDQAAEPNQDNSYGFFGYIQQDMNGIYLQRAPAIKAPLKFRRSDGEFHIFTAAKQIKNREEYAGTSGAPIFDYQGRLVALACKVKVGTNMIYGFSMAECIYLIDLTLNTPNL